MSDVMEAAAYEIYKKIRMPNWFRVEVDPITDNVKVTDTHNPHFGCIVTRKCVEENSHLNYVRDAVAKSLALSVPKPPEPRNILVGS